MGVISQLTAIIVSVLLLKSGTGGLIMDELEQVKRERLNQDKGCEYCLDDSCPPLDWKYGLDHIFPDYRFCPMCGRDLKGEDNG